MATTSQLPPPVPSMWPQTLEEDSLLRWYANAAVRGGLRKLWTVSPDDREQAKSRDEAASGAGFDWLRKANDEGDRASRRRISKATSTAVDCRGYILGGSHTVPLRCVSDMVEGTRLISPSLGEWPVAASCHAPASTSTPLPQITVVKDVVFSAALDACRGGRRVVAVNAASAYHTGGGFQTGGRHALEEAMCTQSTLYASLHRAEELGETAGVRPPSWVRPPTQRDGSPWHPHLPDDGVAFSPFVEIFRKGTADGYAFEDSCVQLDAVISVAMPNCNDRMSDSPVDAHPEPSGYVLQVEQKWRAVLAAVECYTEADYLVVPDAGCGVFRNPPSTIGAALGRVLRLGEFGRRVKEVIIAFPGGAPGEEFARAASAALEGLPPVSQNLQDPAPPTARSPTSLGPKAEARVIWEFGVRAGWERFDTAAESLTEAAWQKYKSFGEPLVARIPSRGKIILVDFHQMVQQVEGNNRQRLVRRLNTQ